MQKFIMTINRFTFYTNEESFNNIYYSDFRLTCCTITYHLQQHLLLIFEDWLKPLITFYKYTSPFQTYDITTYMLRDEDITLAIIENYIYILPEWKIIK